MSEGIGSISFGLPPLQTADSLSLESTAYASTVPRSSTPLYGQRYPDDPQLNVSQRGEPNYGVSVDPASQYGPASLGQQSSQRPLASRLPPPSVSPQSLQRSATGTGTTTATTATAATPAAKPAKPGPGETQVKVEPDETLWELSMRYGVSLDALRERNGIEGNRLVANTNIVIPAPHATRVQASWAEGQDLTTFATEHGFKNADELIRANRHAFRGDPALPADGAMLWVPRHPAAAAEPVSAASEPEPPPMSPGEDQEAQASASPSVGTDESEAIPSDSLLYVGDAPPVIEPDEPGLLYTPAHRPASPLDEPLESNLDGGYSAAPEE